LSLRECSDRVQYAGPIPAAFNADVFDDAVTHIKHLIFLNTWPKFVQELRMRRPSSSEMARSEKSVASTTRTWASKTARHVIGLFPVKSA
jgi:hypothetical protein